MRPKSTAEVLQILSIVLLFAGFTLTIKTDLIPWRVGYLILNLTSYGLSFSLLYLSQKFRYFIIYPPTLVYTRQTKYQILPWRSENETRWPAKLIQIELVASSAIEITELSVMGETFVSNGSPLPVQGFKIQKKMGKTVYSINFESPLEIDINTNITFEITRNENLDEPQSFLEYTIKYKPPFVPFTFKDSRRIL